MKTQIIHVQDQEVASAFSPCEGVVMTRSPWKISNIPSLRVFCPVGWAGKAGYTHTAVPVGPTLCMWCVCVLYWVDESCELTCDT